MKVEVDDNLRALSKAIKISKRATKDLKRKTRRAGKASGGGDFFGSAAEISLKQSVLDTEAEVDRLRAERVSDHI